MRRAVTPRVGRCGKTATSPKEKGPAGPLFRTAVRTAYCVIGVKLTSGSHG